MTRLPVLVAGATAVLLCPAPASAAARFQLPGQVPAAATNTPALRRLAATDTLVLSLGLPLRNRPALTNLLHDLYTPGNPRFHHFLMPAEFTDAFAPTTADYAAVQAFAEAHRLTVAVTHPNRTLLTVRGRVGDIERLFQVELHVHQHPSEAREFFAPDREPSVEASVPLLTVGGLNNYRLPRALVRPAQAQDNLAKPQSGSGPGGRYFGYDFRTAYAPGVALTGAGQVVGLLEFDGFNASDIQAYVAQASLPSVPITTELIDGFDGSAGPQNNEVALDIEMAIAMAPGLAGIIVYEMPNFPDFYSPNDVLNRIAIENLAAQVSSSWTFPADANTDQVFQQFQAQGQSFFNASGDSGAYPGAPSPPTDNPFITIVGGTTLTTSDFGGEWLEEKAWNWYNNGSGTSGSGGGVSANFAEPAWQQAVSMDANQGSTSQRNLPDVALVADNVWAIYSLGVGSALGGTSVAAPLWAAFTALVNEQAAASGLGRVGFINPAVYALGLGSNYITCFHDITTGNNTNHLSPTRFEAVPGYDLCTGWGTPAGKALIDALAPPRHQPVVTNAGAVLLLESCVPTNGVIDPGETVCVSLALRNIGGADTTNLVASVLPSPDILSPSGPQAFGVLAAGGPPSSRAFIFTAAGACGSSISAQLHLQDGPISLGTLSYPLRLGRPLAPLSESFDGTAAPALPAAWVTAASGAGSNWITVTRPYDSPFQSAFGAEPAFPGVSTLVSPPATVSSPTAQLVFRHYYILEADPNVASNAYDGGVLELSIGGGAFADILAAGGSFAAGGYTRTIVASGDNPLAGRTVWSGNSGGFITTTVNLPATAAGQTLQARWRLGTDTGNAAGAAGWYLDTVSILEGYSCCDTNANITPIIDPSRLGATPTNVTVTVNSLAGLTYTLEYTDNLTGHVWTPLQPAVPGTGGSISLVDTNGVAGPSRFYRVRSH